MMLNLSGDRKVIQIGKLSRRDRDPEKLGRIEEEIAAKIVVGDRPRKQINRVAGFDLACLNDEDITAAFSIALRNLKRNYSECL